MTDPRISLGQRFLPDEGAPVLDALDGVRPVIKVGPAVGDLGAVACGALYSMLIRLYPHTAVDGEALLGTNPWGAGRLSDLPARLARSIPVPTRDPDHDLAIAIGTEIGAADLWMGGDDWTARLGRSPQTVGGRSLGLGLQAAAALAAAEVMKLVLGPFGMINVPSGGELVWNLANYQLSEAPTLVVPALRPVVALWLGAGSVGSSVAGVAGCVADLRGSADVVDPDNFDPARNPYRYPAALGTGEGPKADWVGDLLKQAGWSARPFVSRVGDWVRSQPEPGFPGVAVSSVDRVDGRLQVADVMAATTLSVGVDGLALHLQREQLADNWACSYCDYVSLDPPMGQVQVIANLVGLPVHRVARLYLDGEPLVQADLEQAVAAGRVRPDRIAELAGRRIDDLIRRAYAEATVALPGAGTASVSAPFVSWMCGVLVVAELVKAAVGAPLVDRRVDLDMSGVPLGVIRKRPRDNTGHCTCESPWRKRWAATLYKQWHQTKLGCWPA